MSAKMLGIEALKPFNAPPSYPHTHTYTTYTHTLTYIYTYIQVTARYTRRIGRPHHPYTYTISIHLPQYGHDMAWHGMVWMVGIAWLVKKNKKCSEQLHGILGTYRIHY